MGRNHTEPQGGWFKVHRSNEFRYLMKHQTNAYLLLCLIASRARYHDKEGDDSLQINEAYIGDHDSCGLTRGEYRTAINVLKKREHITTRKHGRDSIAKLVSNDVFEPTNEMTSKLANINAGKTTNVKSPKDPELIGKSMNKLKGGNQYNKGVDSQSNDQRNDHKQENKENKETTTTSAGRLNQDVVVVLNKYQITGKKSIEIASHPLADAKTIDDICSTVKLGRGRQGAMVNNIFASIENRKRIRKKRKKKKITELKEEPKEKRFTEIHADYCLNEYSKMKEYVKSGGKI